MTITNNYRVGALLWVGAAAVGGVGGEDEAVALVVALLRRQRGACAADK